MIAAYYRLSQADEVTNGKEESNSIVNQKNLIRSYIAEHADLASRSMTEFTDDGFSGTNLDRPAFQQMMDGVKRGMITCIIVKDFSRFARNYIEAGDYIERIFPFLGVRFIAVTDGYDSEDLGSGDSKNMEMVIKNVINAAYSKDISAKICASNQVKRNQQQYLGGLRPYGFLPDPNDRHKLIVDPVAGGYVKRIFALACEGIKPVDIARILKKENVPTPSVYFLKTEAVKKHTKSWKSGFELWDTQKIRYILQNEKYKGTFVALKTVQTSPCSKNTVKNQPELIVKTENAHVAIVTPEMFEAAQRVIKSSATRAKRTVRTYPLKGKVICGGCGRNMSWDERYGKYGTYRCKNTAVGRSAACSKERILTENLLDTVCDAFWSKYDLLRSALDTVRLKDEEYFLKKSALEQRIAEIKEQKHMLSVSKVNTYENYADGLMDREDFLMHKQKFEKEYDSMESIQREAAFELDVLIKQGKPRGEMLECVMALPKNNEDQEQLGIALDEFVERIIVYDKNRIEVVWRFTDEIAEILKTEI